MASDIDNFFLAEAREILEALARGLLDLERNPHRIEAIKECFRLAHTLTGAARVVGRTQISEIAHAIEDGLSPFRDGDEQLTGEYVTDLLALLDTIRLELNSFREHPETRHRTSHPALPEEAAFERIETVRVEIDE